MIHLCKALIALNANSFTHVKVQVPPGGTVLCRSGRSISYFCCMRTHYVLRSVFPDAIYVQPARRTTPILLIRANTNALRAFPLRVVPHLRASQCYAAVIFARDALCTYRYQRRWAEYFARNATLPHYERN